MNDEYFMSIALKEAKKAIRKNDVPVGAVKINKNKIIARGHNKKEYKKDATLHAEMIVIKKACRKLKSWYLTDCILYITLEPCMMCTGAIIQSRIKKIIYATASPKFGYIESLEKIENQKNNHIPKIEKGIYETESSYIIKKFFENKRG